MSEARPFDDKAKEVWYDLNSAEGFRGEVKVIAKALQAAFDLGKQEVADFAHDSNPSSPLRRF